MRNNKFKVFISDWDIPTNCILALVHNENLFVIDEFSVESSLPTGCFRVNKPTDRYIVIHHKLEYSRYSMKGFELMVDGKIRDDVLWFSIKKKKGSYVVTSPYSFVDSVGYLTCFMFFVFVLVTAGLATFFLLSLYKKSLTRTSRVLRMMQGRVFELVTNTSAYKKLEQAPSVFTSKDFDMEMNFQDYLAQNKSKEESTPVKQEEKEMEKKNREEEKNEPFFTQPEDKVEPISLIQDSFIESLNSSSSDSYSSASSLGISSMSSSSLEESTSSTESISMNMDSDSNSSSSDYSVSESSLPMSLSSDTEMPSEQAESEAKTTTKKRTIRRKKSSV